MSKPIIEDFTDGYRLTVGEESSSLVPYGSPMEVELGGKRWLAFIDLPNAQEESTETETQLESWLYEVVPVAEEDIDFVEGDDEDLDEDDDDDQVEVTVPEEEEVEGDDDD